jgi:hypothetical protein
LYNGFTTEGVVLLVVFIHRDIETARYPLIFLKLEVGPFSIIEKLGKGVLQVVEYSIVCTLYLGVVDIYDSLELLSHEWPAIKD